ncbi:MAG: hypothetical protein U0W65_06200 [Bacteroidia bacterium]|nr:hypothetical protein [Bacteroidia bacterium]
MKNLILVATSLILVSCAKKDWNCKCTVNGDDYEKTITHTTQSKANTDCSNYGKSIGQMYGNYSYVCKVN